MASDTTRKRLVSQRLLPPMVRALIRFYIVTWSYSQQSTERTIGIAIDTQHGHRPT
ncbi:hypothetical protein CCM_02019 [Cordyceps militaris CM01]|uniref:Uncharacterized protein n=1 Tax=Cordyceps militaris (strain CM01) TaxID=983644 RepID=G3JC85_CORMM|nr:uncharacterized protein CCM_02019 [Cordyceps militaris CM01]EGX93750.1 hypothetical protein CCM_02019 [Cordyceps militaris CM01]